MTPEERMAAWIESVSWAGKVGRWEDTPETGASEDEPEGLAKSHIRGHLRRTPSGGIATVRDHEDSRTKQAADSDIEAILGREVPDFFQIDKDFEGPKNRKLIFNAEHPNLYYSPNRPLTWTSASQYGNVHDRYLAAAKPLPVSVLANLELAPVNAETRGHLMLTHYREKYGGAPVVLTKTDLAPQGVVISPSAKEPGKYQVTYFDARGFSSDHAVPSPWPGERSIEQVVGNLTRQGYLRPNPDVLEYLMQDEEFLAGNARTHKMIQKALQKSRDLQREAAKRIGDKLGVDWDAIPLDEFAAGMRVELEHGDVTHGNMLETGRIAWVHLKESPTYYSDLKKYVEKALRPVTVLLKSHVQAHERHLASGAVAMVREHEDSRQKRLDPFAMTTRQILSHPLIREAEAHEKTATSTHTIDTPERRELRAKIATELYGKGAKRQEKKAYILLGPPASGKSTVADALVKETGALIVDSDMAKEKLPEFAGGKGASAVHLESKAIIDKVLERAVRSGDNVILPLVGHEHGKLKRQVSDLQELGYDVHVHLVHLPPHKTFRRAVARFAETGRYIPPRYIFATVGASPAKNYLRLIEEGVIDHGKAEAYSSDVPRGVSPRRLSDSDLRQEARLRKSLRAGRHGVECIGQAGGRAALVLLKSHVRAYQRTTKTGQAVQVQEHDDKRTKRGPPPKKGQPSRGFLHDLHDHLTQGGKLRKPPEPEPEKKEAPPKKGEGTRIEDAITGASAAADSDAGLQDLPAKLREKCRREAPGHGHEIQLTKTETKTLLQKGVVGFVSAGRNPNDPQDAELPENVIQKRTEELRSDLVARGFKFERVKGKYGEEEESFMVMVPAVARKEIVEIGKKFNQDSVIWADHNNNELIFTTGQNQGKRHIGNGFQALKAEAADFYTEIKTPKGALKFSLNFDFSKLVKALLWLLGLEALQKGTRTEGEVVNRFHRDLKAALDQEVLDPPRYDRSHVGTAQGRIDFQGLPITVETRRGAFRLWRDPNTGGDGITRMQMPYGYVRGTLGVAPDGDHLDVFVGPYLDSDRVFVVHQRKAPDFAEWDEDKVMLGFTSAAEARTMYLKHYTDKRFLGSTDEMSMDEFKSKIRPGEKPKMIKGINSLLLRRNT